MAKDRRTLTLFHYQAVGRPENPWHTLEHYKSHALEGREGGWVVFSSVYATYA